MLNKKVDCKEIENYLEGIAEKYGLQLKKERWENSEVYFLKKNESTTVFIKLPYFPHEDKEKGICNIPEIDVYKAVDKQELSTLVKKISDVFKSPVLYMDRKSKTIKRILLS